jgi:hypothetical protein
MWFSYLAFARPGRMNLAQDDFADILDDAGAYVLRAQPFCLG